MATRHGAVLTAVALAVTVGAGCSDDSAGSESSRLVISVSGLPDDVDAEVTVRGPDGFSETVSESTDLDAAPGDYTLEVAAVDVSADQTPADIGSGTWHPLEPMLRPSVEPGETTTAVADYASLVPDTTKVVDADDSGLLRPVSVGRTLVFAADSDIAASVREGDVLVAEPGPRTPAGLLREVLAVRRTADRVEVDTRPATLSDAAPVGRIDAEATLSLPGPVGQRGMALAGRSADPPGATITLGEGPCTAGGKLSGQVDVGLRNLRVRLSGAWDGDEWVEEPSLAVSVQQFSTIAVTGSGSVSCTATAKVPPAPIFLGVIPTAVPGVVVTAELDFPGSLSAAMTAGAGFSVTQNASLTVGGEYVDGEPRPISEVSNQFDVPTEPIGEYSLSLRGGARLQLLIDKVVGPELTLQAGVTGTMNSATSMFKLTGGVYGDLGFKLTLFGVKDLAGVTWPNVVKDERVIWPNGATVPGGPGGGPGGPGGPGGAPYGHDECAEDPTSVCVNTDLAYGTGEWQIEPERLQLGAGNVVFEDLRWEGWGGPTAIGRGYRLSTNCVPNCASGQVTRKPVIIELSQKIPVGDAWGYVCNRGRLIGKPWGSAGWERTCIEGNLPSR